jgi:hypothetical protein
VATKKGAAFTWSRKVVGTEGTPILVADARAFASRSGDEGDGPAAFVDVLGDGASAVVLLDTEGGGAADVGWDETDTIVLLATSDFDDAPKQRDKLVKAIETAKHPEYLVGEIALAGDLVVEDGAAKGSESPAFRLPRAPGRYTVVEGHVEGDGEARWCRITPVGRKAYARRPSAPKVDPVEAELARISFATPIAEARALEAAVRLIGLGRPELALEICAKASPARRALAAWTRVMALAAQRDAAARDEVSALATQWLAPADSAEHASQVVPRAQLLQAIDVVSKLGSDGALDALRGRVVSAPEPEVFVPEGDGDFF